MKPTAATCTWSAWLSLRSRRVDRLTGPALGNRAHLDVAEVDLQRARDRTDATRLRRDPAAEETVAVVLREARAAYATGLNAWREREDAREGKIH